MTDRERDGETDLGVPFPGRVVAPEQRTRARVSIPRRGPFDWARTFGRGDAKRVLDLGCGNGRYLIASAIARAACDHLGVDLVPPAIQHAARRAGERGLANVKFAWADALEVIFDRIEPDSVDEVHVYHPQPYYDASKIERRMLTPEALGRIRLVLRRGGLFVLQTDNPHYWRYASQLAPRLFRWREQRAPWPDAPAGRTRREIVARAKGLTIFRGLGEPLELERERADALVRAMPRPTFDANKGRFRGRGGRRP